MRISILALEGLFDTGLTVLLDAFTLANKFSAGQMGGRPRFDVSIVGVRKRVRTAQGLAIPVQSITAALKPDWVVVPALSTGTPEQLVPALGRPDVSQARAQLLKWHAESGAYRPRLVSGPSFWRRPDCSINGRQLRPGGSHRCFGNATPMFCSTSLACLCRQTWGSLLAQRWGISISPSG